MDLSVKISRLSNLLFFASDQLSYQKFGPLFFGKNKDDIWGKVRLTARKKDLEKIRHAVVISEKSFSYYWVRASRNLASWKKYFQNSQPRLASAVLALKAVVGAKDEAIARVPIFLVSTPSSDEREIEAWFSWSPKEEFMVVEIPINLKPGKSLFPLAIIAHEFFHLLVRRNRGLLLKIKKASQKCPGYLPKLEEKISAGMFLEELLVSSFIPEGYIGKRYFGFNQKTYSGSVKSLVDWRRFVAVKLRVAAKKYVDGARKIDDEYLGELICAIRSAGK